MMPIKMAFVLYNRGNTTMPPHTSEIEKNLDALAATTAEKTPDFAELKKEKGELFREIEEKSLKLDLDDKRQIVGLISGFSIKDGFEIAKTLGVDGFDYFSELALGENIRYKNGSFYNAFGPFLIKNKIFVNNQIDLDIIDNFNKGENFKDVPDMENAHPSDFYQAGTYPYPPEDILKKVEDYYSHFIRNRRVKSPELAKDGRTQVER